MLSVSYMNNKRSINYASEVLTVINENINYIRFFNKTDWEEAKQRIFIQAMEHPRHANALLPYIKKLAREIMKKSDKEQNEYITNVYNDNGDINYHYLGHKTELKISDIEGSEEIYNELKEIYLHDSEAFLKLQSLTKYDDVGDIQDLRLIRERNKVIFERIRTMMTRHGIEQVTAVIQQFIKDLPCLTQPVQSTIKTIELKVRNKNILTAFKEKTRIEYEDNKKGLKGFNQDFITEGDPDYNKWGIKGQSKFNIVRVDITPYIEYIYKQVYVDAGIQTPHIQWCGDSYRLDTAGGEYFINLDKDKFIVKTRIELITNLLHQNLHVLAVTEDNIYLKTKKMAFKTLRLAFRGRVIDLPVELYK